MTRTEPIAATPCTWCLKPHRSMSEWEQKNLRGEWKRLCKPCARVRLNNPWNALLGMRKIELEPSDV